MADMIRWRPFHSLMKEFFNDLTPFFDSGDMLSERASDFMPHIDIRETDKNVEVTVDLPGMNKKDIEVAVDEGVLSISGERKDERKKEDDGRVYYERRYGRFERCVRLPENVDGDKIEGEYKDGVLTLNIPKRPETKPERKKISIR